MKSSEILREAARSVERGLDSYGCWAIVDAAEADYGLSLEETIKNSAPATKAMTYFRLLSPRIAFSTWWDFDDQGPRIIGLCLAAAIAESEGD
jgi:hypothetical protein